MSIKKLSRLRRARKTRGKIARLNVLPRLTVYRSAKHIYAQVFSPRGDKVLVSASSLEKSFSGKSSGNKEGAQIVGQMIAEKAKAAGIEKVAFDRSGFKYHGRVKALADAARESGIDF